MSTPSSIAGFPRRRRRCCAPQRRLAGMRGGWPAFFFVCLKNDGARILLFAIFVGQLSGLYFSESLHAFDCAGHTLKHVPHQSCRRRISSGRSATRINVSRQLPREIGVSGRDRSMKRARLPSPPSAMRHPACRGPCCTRLTPRAAPKRRQDATVIGVSRLGERVWSAKSLSLRNFG
jgi:hypothetical protein